MEPFSSRNNARPLYVSLGLLGISSRKAAAGYMWLCIATALLGAVLGFYRPVFFFAVPLLISAVWYWAAIRWTDRNGSWQRDWP